MELFSHGTREPLEKSILVMERNRIKMRQKKKGESSHGKQNFVRWGLNQRGMLNCKFV